METGMLFPVVQLNCSALETTVGDGVNASLVGDPVVGEEAAGAVGAVDAVRAVVGLVVVGRGLKTLRMHQHWSFPLVW